MLVATEKCLKGELSMDYENITTESSQLTERIQSKFDRERCVTIMRREHNVTTLKVPKITGESLPERRLVFTDTQNETKALLYSVIVAAYNYAFTDRFAPKSAAGVLNANVSPFVDYLNKVEIENKYELFKNYEAHRFDEAVNHGGHSALTSLKTIFNYAFQDERFVAQLSSNDMQFLRHLRDTKKSPNVNKRQISLSSYFGELPWLRDEQDGVGADYYNLFASPKILVNSLKCLSSTLILEFYEAKCALKAFLKANKELVADIQNNFAEGKQAKGTKSARRVIRTNAVTKTLYAILLAYHERETPSPSLENAISLLLCSMASSNSIDDVQEGLNGIEGFKKILCHVRNISGSDDDCSLDKGRLLFSASFQTPALSMDMLLSLVNDDDLPITIVEKLMFMWLMACLTVQPSDIYKLTKTNFRMFKVDGRVTDIECEYFKGRANAVHTTRSLSLKKADGKALLVYLNQNPGESIDTYQGSLPALSPGSLAVTGALVNLINLPFMSEALHSTHQRFNNTPKIIPMALTSIVQNGVSTQKLGVFGDKGHELVEASDRGSKTSVFSLSAIKNSAVHAYSDPYTLHYLINRNSHTNKTEKENYLNADNEAWINAAGRITRSVMQDLINNVFNLDFSDSKEEERQKAEIAFNNEFKSVKNVISNKSEEMLSRMKVVTEQNNGVINEVGVLSQTAASRELFTPIYVLDSPSTVCKMYNYLHEFEENYRRLLSQNPHHLYQTAMPTAEWIQKVLAGESLSDESKTQGKALYEKMRLAGVSMQVFHSL